jgi:hypothetical protein
MFPTNKVVNENLTKLKELSERICSFELNKNDDSCKIVLGEIIDIIENSQTVLLNENDKESKLLCYESMCFKLKSILKKIKN